MPREREHASPFRGLLYIFSTLIFSIYALIGFGAVDTSCPVQSLSGMITIREGTTLAILSETSITAITEKGTAISLKLKKNKVIRFRGNTYGRVSELHEILAEEGTFTPEIMEVTITPVRPNQPLITKSVKKSVRETEIIKETATPVPTIAAIALHTGPFSPTKCPNLTSTGDHPVVSPSKSVMLRISATFLVHPPEHVIFYTHLILPSGRTILLAHAGRAPPTSSC